MVRLSVFMVLAFLCSSTTAIEAAEHPKYKDPKQPLHVRIKDLMSRMTLEEKIGQMTMIELNVTSPEVIRKYHIGNILIAGGSAPAPHASAEKWMDMTDEFQKWALSDRLGIPIIVGTDAIHGHNNVYNSTIFPHNVGLGATWFVGILDGDVVMKATVKIPKLYKQ